MSIETIGGTQAMDTTEPVLSTSQPSSSIDGEGGIEIMSPIPPSTTDASNDSIDHTATPPTTTGDRITPGQNNQHAGRTRNNDRGSGGGRTSMSGRGLVMGGRTGRNNSYGRGGYNNNNNNNQRRTTIQVHSNSGVPFGHVPAYLPGASSLVEELDQRVLLVLRDGKHIIGTLISFDQFGNLVLTNAVDRQIVSVIDKDNGMKRNYYADIPLEGLYVARGESLVLVGEVHDESNNILMQPVSMEELGTLSASAIPRLEWDFDTDLTA